MTFGAHIPELQLTAQQVQLGLRAADLRPGETYVELGSGEGLNLVAAARDFGALAHGVEILPHAIDGSYALAREEGVQIDVTRGDLMDYDISSADVLLIHLGPAFHDLLASRLETSLPPQARVVACGWRVPGWQPLDLSREFDDFEGYVYRPADPTMQASFVEPLEEIEGEPGTAWVAELVLVAHADLADIEINTSADDHVRVSAEVGRSRLDRGQGTSVLVTGTLPEAGVTSTARFEALGRHARRDDDAVGLRGKPWTLRLRGRERLPGEPVA